VHERQRDDPLALASSRTRGERIGLTYRRAALKASHARERVAFAPSLSFDYSSFGVQAYFTA
jgi:hypothetical protein